MSNIIISGKGTSECKVTPIETLLSYVSEAQTAHEAWRADSWNDFEFRDGAQWSSQDVQRLKDKGITALTINRTFPILNLVYGHYLNNRSDIVAKGRTKEDNELAQVMSEGVQFVIDQNRGQQQMAFAFNQQIITGFGCLQVGFNNDPRKEHISLTPLQWYSVWWDPYASPWMNKEDCRYAFTAAWTNLDDLIALFPEKKSELNEQFNSLSYDSFTPEVYDQGTQVEDQKEYLSSGDWVNTSRRRVRPVEMWYTSIQKSWFAKMPNGNVLDLDTMASPQAQFQAIQGAQEVLAANVKKMRVATFLGNLKLQDCPTPYIHDEYPYVPYVGYLDRYNYPFGIPRQIKEQDQEVNARRSMALSLLSSRRVITEKGAAEDENRVYAEANRQDGFIVMKKDKMNRVKIEEMSNMASSQMDMLMQSEREIQEIAGANDETLGYNSPSRSGKALAEKKQSSATVTASLLENAKYSQKMLGERLTALIQDTWTDEKVLRVTDRVTGAEKFVSINERTYDDRGTTVIRNNITQARFDLVITDKPMTDTMREKNLETIFAAINNAPQEAIGPLLNLALEISDIPNKDLLLDQVRQATGISPLDDNLTTEEREQKTAMEAQAKQEQEQIQQQQEQMERGLENDKTKAEAEKLRADAAASLARAGAEKQKVDQQGYQIGVQTAQMTRNNAQEDTYTPRGEASEGKSKDNNVVPQQKENV